MVINMIENKENMSFTEKMKHGASNLTHKIAGKVGNAADAIAKKARNVENDTQNKSS
jgi:hypothetical protein